MYLLTELQIYDIIVMAQKAAETRKYTGKTQSESRRDTYKKVLDMYSVHELNAPQNEDHGCRN